MNAFGQWGYGRTTRENAYDVGTEEGRYENAQFSLAVSSRPSDDVVVAGQLFVNSEGEVSLDWGFAEYRLSDLLRVRAGKMKNPFGLSMEVKDVGTLRPFFSLPQSIYGPGNMSSEAYLGVGLTGAWVGDAGWSVSYDLFGGALSRLVWRPYEALESATTPYDFSAFEPEEAEVRDVIGGRLLLDTPIQGLGFRASAYTGKAVDEAGAEVRMSVVGLSAEYALDRFLVRAELFQESEGDEETNLAGYAEVAWRFLPRLQGSLRLERALLTREGVPSQFRDHTEGAVGLAFWPSKDLAFKTSYHLVDGNRFALPEMSADDGSVERRTSLFVAGAQFSF